MFDIFDHNSPHYELENTGDSPRLIELGPIVVDYDLPIERMLGDNGRALFVAAMEEFLERPIRYAVDYFPNCHEGRTGKQWRYPLLFRPMPLDESWGLPHILSAIDEAGFFPEELPSLASLGPISESIYTVFGGRVFFVGAVGPNSLMKKPSHSVRYGLQLRPDEGELNVTEYRDEDGGHSGHSGQSTWFLVRRKADD
jgi:hypothetical protein